MSQELNGDRENYNPIAAFIVNALYSRSDWNQTLLDGKYGTRDIDAECGYPVGLTVNDYIAMYERNDIAARVVDIEPNECWKEYPEIYETEEERETEFEQAVDKVISDTNLYTYLVRADRVSGIGRYGVLFLGFDDGKEFDKPAPGYNDDGPESTPGKSKILYYRVLDESGVSISKFETDPKNPRYGLPKEYSLTFQEVSSLDSSLSDMPAIDNITVHWSRIIHIADNMTTSEVYGTPRMKNVFNRLYDLRKIHGGAAEMFWKGGFPGYSFEVDPKHGEFSTDDKNALKEETKNYSEGLVRYLTTVGVSVRSLAPQVADPQPHIDTVLRTIAITKGIPMRLFMGAEQGNLASTQDAGTWGERVAFRRNMYVTPHIIRPTIDRLIQAGAIPGPKEGTYTVKWTPLATLTEVERAQVGKDLTEALARYATAGAEALIPLPEFLGKFLGFSYQQVEAVMKAAPTELSVVLQQLAAGMMAGSTGSSSGNVPTSVPNMAKKKDPSKTPVNVVQTKKKKESATKPPTTQG